MADSPLRTVLARARRLARPAKVVSAVHRREFEWRLARLPLQPIGELEDVGSHYGGWIVPVDRITRDWTCYSIGAGADVTFDLELARRFGARVRSFEPVELYVQMAREAGAGVERFSAHHAAIALEDGAIEMQHSHEARSGSLSAAGLYESPDSTTVPGRTIPSLMQEFGDSSVELLKVDVEGLEYDLLPALDFEAMGVQVLTVQVHHNRRVADVRKLLAGLRDVGFVLVGNRPTIKLTLVRTPPASRQERAG